MFTTKMFQRTGMVVSSSFEYRTRLFHSIHVWKLENVVQCIFLTSTSVNYLRKKDLFYVRHLEKVTSEPDKPWYSSVPFGKHNLHLAHICIHDDKLVTRYKDVSEHNLDCNGNSSAHVQGRRQLELVIRSM